MRTPTRLWHRLALLTGLLTIAAVLTGCPAPIVTPLPPTAGPTATTAPTASPTPAGTPTPQGWSQRTTGDVSIFLPQEWQVLEFSSGDLQTIFADFEKKNPDLAKIIGSADALQGVALWAFGPAAKPGAFIDNLNIRRTPLNGQKIGKMQEVVDPIVAQYKQLGFEEINSNPDLQISGRPAAYITYSFPFTASDGKPGKVAGHQYLVATDTDLWILSYSAGPESAATSQPVFDQSAKSFTVK